MNQNVVQQPIVWPESFKLTRTTPPGSAPGDDVATRSDIPNKKDAAGLARSKAVLDRVVAKTQIGSIESVADYLQNSPKRKSRFNDGSYRVWYAGETDMVALAETIHHHQLEMTRDKQPAGTVTYFQMLVVPVDGVLDDVSAVPRACDPNSYNDSQPLGASLRANGSHGVVWESVRHVKDRCIGLFKADVAGDISQGDVYMYYWNGNRVDKVKNVSTGKLHSVSGSAKIKIT